MNQGGIRSNKSATPYRINDEVNSHLDVSHGSEHDHATDDPVLESFEKNRSQVIRNGSRIVIKKGNSMKAQQNNLQALKQRISEQSTNPDS